MSAPEHHYRLDFPPPWTRERIDALLAPLGLRREQTPQRQDDGTLGVFVSAPGDGRRPSLQRLYALATQVPGLAYRRVDVYGRLIVSAVSITPSPNLGPLGPVAVRRRARAAFPGCEVVQTQAYVPSPGERPAITVALTGLIDLSPVMRDACATDFAGLFGARARGRHGKAYQLFLGDGSSAL